MIEVIKIIEVTKEKPDGEVVSERMELFDVLQRAANESESLDRLGRNPREVPRQYYTLTTEERAALASCDIRKIEAWVRKLDEELAIWLWCRLAQEEWG